MKKKRKDFKILTSKQMHQRLPIAPALVKEGNTFENLLKKIRRIIYSLYNQTKLLKNYIAV